MDTLGGTELILESRDQFVQFFQHAVAAFAAAAYISHVKSHIMITYSRCSSSICSCVILQSRCGRALPVHLVQGPLSQCAFRPYPIDREGYDKDPQSF